MTAIEIANLKPGDHVKIVWRNFPVSYGQIIKMENHRKLVYASNISGVVVILPILDVSAKLVKITESEYIFHLLADGPE